MLSNRELDLLLEVAWWRQEYGAGISYATRYALLGGGAKSRRIRSDRPSVVAAALPSQSQEPEAVSRLAAYAAHAPTRPNVDESR